MQQSAFPASSVRGIPKLGTDNFRLARPVAVRYERAEGFMAVPQRRHLRESDDRIHDILDLDAEERREVATMAELEKAERTPESFQSPSITAGDSTGDLTCEMGVAADADGET